MEILIPKLDILQNASELLEKSDTIQCSTFLHMAGPAAQHVYESWTIANEDKDGIAKLDDKFVKHCSPCKTRASSEEANTPEA